MHPSKPSPLDTGALLAFHSLLFGDAKMEEDGEKTPPAKTFTQDEVNALVARETDKAKNKTASDLAKELGVDLDTAKAVVKASKEQEDAQKTEAQKAREAADKEKAKAEDAVKTSNAAIHRANLTVAMVTAGVDPAKIDRYSKLVEVETGADEAAIKAAVEKLKTEEPALFGTQSETPPPATPPRVVTTAPGSHIQGTPPKPKVDEGAYARGLERAKQYSTAYTGVMPGVAQS